MQGVCHRDLKLENILLDNSSPPHIKICDFGYSKVGTIMQQQTQRRQNKLCAGR